MDWSYELLSEAERALLARLAVFSGGFSLTAVTTVCAGGVIEPKGSVALLAGLVDKSLVVRGTGTDENRYHLLETIRQYAAPRLADAGEEDALRSRHARWVLELLAGRADETFGTPEWGTSTLLLNTERANLVAALDWSLSGADSATGRDLARRRSLAGGTCQAGPSKAASASSGQPPSAARRSPSERGCCSDRRGPPIWWATSLRPRCWRARESRPLLPPTTRSSRRGAGTWSPPCASSEATLKASAALVAALDKPPDLPLMADRPRSYTSSSTPPSYEGDFAEGLELAQAAVQLARDTPAGHAFPMANIVGLNLATIVGDAELHANPARRPPRRPRRDPRPAGPGRHRPTRHANSGLCGATSREPRHCARRPEGGPPGGVRYAPAIYSAGEAVVAAAAGDRHRARRALRHAVALGRALEYRPFESLHLSALAVVAALDGDTAGMPAR